MIKRILYSFIIHFLAAWVLIIIITVVPYAYATLTTGPYLFYPNGTPVTIPQYFIHHLDDLIVIALFILLGEIVYHLFFKKAPLVRYALLCLLPSITGALLSIVLFQNRYKDYDYWGLLPPIFIGAVYILALSLIRDYFKQRKFQEEIDKQQVQLEIDALQAQINPHFLFNSLNYLYSSAIKENAATTADGIATLSEMMRHTVQEARNTFVPLKKELDFLQNYLKLFLDRLPQSVIDLVEIKIDVEANEHDVPPLLLIPFIENAFKYGISIENPMPIKISLVVINGILKLHTRNSVVNQNNSMEGTNTGSINTQKRLHLLYQNRHELTFRKNKQTYEVNLQLLLN